MHTNRKQKRRKGEEEEEGKNRNLLFSISPLLLFL
jgi:hypothetical protein